MAPVVDIEFLSRRSIVRITITIFLLLEICLLLETRRCYFLGVSLGRRWKNEY